jgi:competence CoiA-like predicted nuclease
MSDDSPRGIIYRCPVCGAELAVLGDAMGKFLPRCCDQDMVQKDERAAFYFCPVCGAEIAVLKAGEGEFLPRCCDTPMKSAA